MLPNDIARCSGVAFEEDGEINYREGCDDCRRRTEKRTEGAHHWHMEPPKIIVFECEYRIEP